MSNKAVFVITQVFSLAWLLAVTLGAPALVIILWKLAWKL